jgi:hypothetical protein
MHAVNNPNDIPPGYKKESENTDPKQPVVRLVPDIPQPAAAQSAKKGAGKRVRQSSAPTRQKTGNAQERQPDSREKQKLR